MTADGAREAERATELGADAPADDPADGPADPADGPADPAVGPGDGPAPDPALDAAAQADSRPGDRVEVGEAEPPAAPPRPVNPRSIPKEPEWADQRTMLSEHPRWALATVALLVVGLIVGYTSVVAVGPSLIRKCAALADPAVCNPRTQGLVLALPALALALGLAVSWIGGRRLARRGRKAIHAAVAGWAVFLLTAVICYGVVGGHA